MCISNFHKQTCSFPKLCKVLLCGEWAAARRMSEYFLHCSVWDLPCWPHRSTSSCFFCNLDTESAKRCFAIYKKTPCHGRKQASDKKQLSPQLTEDHGDTRLIYGHDLPTRTDTTSITTYSFLFIRSSIFFLVVHFKFSLKKLLSNQAEVHLRSRAAEWSSRLRKQPGNLRCEFFRDPLHYLRELRQRRCVALFKRRRVNVAVYRRTRSRPAARVGLQTEEILRRIQWKLLSPRTPRSCTVVPPPNFLVWLLWLSDDGQALSFYGQARKKQEECF